ncbi:MAG: flavodoxin domain-containing protein [Planctomycetota bacterium]
MTTDTLTRNGHDLSTRQLTAALQPSAVTPVVPDDAPFNAGQRQWLNGLLTGLSVLANAAASRAGGDAGAAADAPATPIAILYGSQSGNCEALSKDLRKHAKSLGFDPAVRELNDVEPAELAGLGRVLVVCSTFGEGDPPDNAAKFCDKLFADGAPALDGLSFSVCGMGDSSYTHFNKTGRDLDARLAELGGTRAAEFVGCDVAYEDDYAAWKHEVFATPEFTADGAAPGPAVADAADEPAERFNKANPFPATILEVTNLNAEGSAKEVNHVAISLAGSGLAYEPGDALGVWPVNCPDEARQILAFMEWTGAEVVTIKGEPTPLLAALLSKLDICTVTPKTLESLGVDASMDGLAGCHLIDVLERFQPEVGPQALIDALRPLQPRLYSIASSPRAHPGEVHLTVGAVRYATHGKPRKGVASTFLADRVSLGSAVGVYLQASAHFHMPDPKTPLIMIGPGTGIAPFRAFLEERSVIDNAGESWLFFGDQHEATDCLYREQIAGWLADGTLDRFDAAWSRDQAEKVYVQHKMLDAGAELWAWLQRGAAVYVCGDATRMAKDVDEALHCVIAEHGGMPADEAAAYVESLKADHRYQRDVY